MTPLPAISLGINAPRGDFAGIVHSVFARAANLRLEDGRLATCTNGDYFEMPLGIRIETPRAFDFQAFLREGESAHCRGGILRFNGGGLKVDLRTARVWNGGVHIVSPPQSRPLDELWHIAEKGINGDATFPLAPMVSHLANLGRKGNQGDMKSLQGLIGTGPGLTPAGDDMVNGYLAAAKSLAPNENWSRTLALLTLQHLSSTNDVSRQMLSDAAAGHFIEPLLNMLSAIYGARPVNPAAGQLMSIGATSGPAMLLGLLTGIMRVEDSRLPAFGRPAAPTVAQGRS